MLALALSVALAAAAEEDESVVEDTAVKNRLFSVAGRWEAGASVGFSSLPRLTDHYVFDATAAYNVWETLAVEAIAGYAYSRQTELARSVATAPMTGRPSGDLSDLWTMKGHGLLGVRWQPLYGKLSVFSEAVHFQFYAWAGAGAAYFVRDAIVMGPLHQEQLGPLFSVALGMRFFLSALGDHHALRIEGRDFSWLDSFRNASGTTSRGLTNLLQVNVGYTFVF